ncbi:aldo/keto reductase [Sphingobacterium griseoflavum]|nr:aldo/keto reductase [Sphingobacterium griseoflavum]
MEYMTLNDGQRIPLLGFGTYKATAATGVESVREALRQGYRLLDTAAKYENEEQIGEGIRLSGLSRKDIIVTTKLWREDLGYAQTKQAFDRSLKKLGLQYVDIYLIHWPANAKNYSNWRQANADAWRAMEELQAEGKIKSIGVSNFWPEHLDALLQTARVLPALNQIEFHPGYWQPEVVAYCQKRGIAIESWSPLARGKVFGHPVLEGLAQKHGKSVSQLCLRWVIQHGVSVIPKTTSPERMAENLDIFNFSLTDEEMRQIDHLPEMGFSGELPNNWPDRV